MPPKSSKFRGVTLFRPTKKWRAQISAAGKTTSLGDHDTEEEAARAFDRAAINKAGAAAQTNYPLQEYADEMDALRRVSVSELVATLRAKARRHGTQTSQYRGVSLLKQTGKWHGQINVGGKQLHLGFFATEELAARAYDRAAIHKASMEGGVVVTNLDISVYESEMHTLKTATRAELLALIADEKKNENGATTKAARAARTSSAHVPSGSGSGSAGTTTMTTQHVKPTFRSGSGSGSGSEGDAEARSNRPALGTQARDVASGGSSRETTTRGDSPPSDGTTRHLTQELDSSDVEEDDPTPAGSDGDKPSGDSNDAATTAVHDGQGVQRRPVSKSHGGRQQEAQSKSSAGRKRPAPKPPPFVSGKQRRTKQAPTRAPCAA